MLGYVSMADEVVPLKPVKVPNFERAITIAQRSAAQKGQYSAPMYRISGLPSEHDGLGGGRQGLGRAGPRRGSDFAAAARVLTGTSSTCEIMLGVRAKVPGLADPLLVVLPPLTFNTTTTAMSTTTAPVAAIAIQMLRCRRCSAARARRGALLRAAGPRGARARLFASRPLGYRGRCATRTRRDVASSGTLLCACHLRLSPSDGRPPTSLTNKEAAPTSCQDNLANIQPLFRTSSGTLGPPGTATPSSGLFSNKPKRCR